MSQLPQFPSDKERLMRIEVILTQLTETTKNLEASIRKHIEDSIEKEQDIEKRLSDLANAEGERLKTWKYKIIEYIIFAALGGGLTYLATMFSKVAGS